VKSKIARRKRNTKVWRTKAKEEKKVT